MMENELVLKVDNVKKRYRLGVIGGGTLQGDIQSWWARIRGKEDPNSKIGTEIDTKKGSFMALDGISFEVKKGERLGIIGGNGAGKSTTLKILSRVTAPTEGTVYINGRISSMLEVGTGFHPELTGRENIYLNGAILGMSKEEVDRKIEDIIEFSECRQFIDTPVKRYSSGMYVKLAFSVAAHLDSEILIMDEVLAVGDMKFQQKCLNKMRDVAEKEGRTVLYVSHNMNTIRQLCDRCIVLDRGKVKFDGDVEDAIKIYMGIDNSEELSPYYNLRKIERHYEFGKQVLITDFRFIGKEKAVYEVGEDIEIELCIDSKCDIKGAQIILPVKDADYVKVGMALSEPFDLKIGIGQRFVFNLNFGLLAQDTYCLDIGIIKRDTEGNYYTYDNPGVKMLVEFSNQYAHGIEWNKKYWGNVMLPEIKMVQ